MINILHIVPALDSGGVENLLLNYYNHIDRDKFKFDFIVYGKEKGTLESAFEKLGSKIYHIPSRHESFIMSCRQMKEIIRCNNYDIVHAHQNRMSFIPLYYAKKYGVHKRIAHSHMAFEPEGMIKKLERKLFSVLIKHYATDWFACGADAAKWLYGNTNTTNNKVYIMKNAICIEKYAFNTDVRNQKRKELGVEDKFVIGHVGRFSYQKNHEYLLNIFNEVYRKNKNAILILVGSGELENSIKEKVKKLGLEDAVKFLGVCNNVNEILQAMDVFLLPSLYEGLPIVLIESQAAGLKSFAADTITSEIKYSSLLEYISLENPPQYWANEILKYSNSSYRKDTSSVLKEAGYDIKEEARKLELLYADC